MVDQFFVYASWVVFMVLFAAFTVFAIREEVQRRRRVAVLESRTTVTYATAPLDESAMLSEILRLIDDLDVGRREGEIYTYAHVQDRLRIIAAGSLVKPRSLLHAHGGRWAVFNANGSAWGGTHFLTEDLATMHMEYWQSEFPSLAAGSYVGPVDWVDHAADAKSAAEAKEKCS